MSFLRKSIFYFSAGIIFLAGTSSALIYFYKDTIIGHTFKELNKHLNAKVEVNEKIGISFLKTFPDISFQLKDLKIYEAIPGSRNMLASANELNFSFDAVDMFRNKFVIKQVIIENADIHLAIDESGNNNYSVFKKDTTASGSVSFDLEFITLKNVYITWLNKRSRQDYQMHVQTVNARLSVSNDIYLIGVDGNLRVNNIRIADMDYFREKDVSIKGELEYSLSSDHYVIRNSVVEVEKAEFSVEGIYHGGKEENIDLKIKGTNSTISTLTSLLPGEISNEFEAYKTEGEVYFISQIQGDLSQGKNPLITVDFGFKNVSLLHESIPRKIEQASLTGNFTNGEAKNSSTSILKLTNISAVMDGKKFKGIFSIKNFDHPYLKINGEGALNLKSLSEYYTFPLVENPSGIIDFLIDFEGKSEDLRNKNENIRAGGQISLNKVAFKLKDRPYSFKEFKGTFIFNNQDVAVNDFSGKAGKSDFLINGIFKNLIGKMLYSKSTLYVEGEFRSNRIFLEELLTQEEIQSLSKQQTKISKDNPFPHLKGINLNLKCEVKHLFFHKMHAKSIKGIFDFSQPRLALNKTSFELAGGSINLDGLMNFRSRDNIELNTKATLSNIRIDSMFYIFDNFDQEFIIDKNLKGLFSGNIKVFLSFNESLSIDPSSVVASIDATITGGELNNFKPMQNLSRFIEERELENIKFSELKNRIYIENRKVSIPEMEIKSNISHISVSGTHSFDQYMDYRLRVPLKNFKKKQQLREEALRAIEEDNKGYSVIFLTIKGHVDDYKIAYDLDKTKDKIKTDLKKEKKELVELFRDRKRNEEIIYPDPEEQEFFDFDD